MICGFFTSRFLCSFRCYISYQSVWLNMRYMIINDYLELKKINFEVKKKKSIFNHRSVIMIWYLEFLYVIHMWLWVLTPAGGVAFASKYQLCYLISNWHRDYVENTVNIIFIIILQWVTIHNYIYVNIDS